MERAQEVVPTDISETEEGYFELDSDDSFNDSFNSDEPSGQPGPKDPAEELENTKPGNIHPFHSCSCCHFIDFDSKMSSQVHLWAKIRTHPSGASEDCEFFRFCREHHDRFLDSAALYICVELKDGRHFPGSKVSFTSPIHDRILQGQSFLEGRAHSGKQAELRC
jgi:hypothetical protein